PAVEAPDDTMPPGTLRNVSEPQAGEHVRLALDAGLQWHVQKPIQSAKVMSGAANASAVVLDAHTGEVRAMANDNTFNPAVGIGAELERGADLGNPAITSPFEPRSEERRVGKEGPAPGVRRRGERREEATEMKAS